MNTLSKCIGATVVFIGLYTGVREVDHRAYQRGLSAGVQMADVEPQNMKLIPLGDGADVIVDARDYDLGYSAGYADGLEHGAEREPSCVPIESN